MRPDTLDRYREQFAQFDAGRRRREPDWLRAARRGALERFAITGLPSMQYDDWKYTNIAPIERRAFRPAAAASRAASAGQLRHVALPGAHALVFVNGHFSADLSDSAGLPDGVRAVSLALALPADTGAIGGHFAAEGEQGLGGFSALNAAFWTDGAYVELAAGVTLAAPIHLLYVSTEPELALYPRTLVRAGPGARATIVEHYVGLDRAACLTNASTRIVADTAAAIEHVRLQQESAQSFHVGTTHVRQGPASSVASFDIALGALLARHDIAVFLDGERGQATLGGLYLAGGRQHIDHHSRVEHASPGCRSRELYKGVLDGAARAVFHGRVVIHAQTQRSDARQANHHLLLSRQAEVDTRPELEIHADDVQCSHGATVGQLDPEQLFYLRTRGVGAAAAQTMLTHAFASEVIGMIDSAPLRARVEQLVAARLAAPPPSPTGGTR